MNLMGMKVKPSVFGEKKLNNHMKVQHSVHGGPANSF